MRVWIGVVSVLGITERETRSACQVEVFTSKGSGRAWIREAVVDLEREKREEWGARYVTVESSLRSRELEVEETRRISDSVYND